MIDDDGFNTNSIEKPDGYWTMIIGLEFFAIGKTMTIGGGVMRKISKRKLLEYKKKLKGFSFHISPSECTFTYDF